MPGAAIPNDWSVVAWHPILSALDQPHALIQIVRRGPKVGHKAVTWALEVRIGAVVASGAL